MIVSMYLALLLSISASAALTLPSTGLNIVPELENLVPPPPNDSPPNYNDVEDEHSKYVLVYKWCISFKYCAQTSKKLTNMAVDEIKAVICKPVEEIKRFYRLDSSNCELTTELLNIMSQPRCAMEDIETCESCRRNKRWTRLGERTWPETPVTYRFKNHLSSSSFSPADQEELAKFCAQLWSANSGLRMQFLNNAPSANIEIEYAYIDGPWNVAGRGLSPTFPGKSYLILDSSEKWKRNVNQNGQGISMQWTMCHEMGHTLGLGHSGDSNAIMYPSEVGQDDSRLSSDDLQGIQALYGGGGSKAPNMAPTETPMRSQTYKTTTQTTSPSTKPEPYFTPRATTRRPARTSLKPSPSTPSISRLPVQVLRYAPPGHLPRYPPSGYVPRTRPSFASR